MWGLIETFMMEEEKAFAIVINCSEHWAWYVINDQDNKLVKAGSDDEYEAATNNAERALAEYCLNLERTRCPCFNGKKPLTENPDCETYIDCPECNGTGFIA